MTIKEVIERNWDGKERLLRIDYIPDNKIDVIKSHTYSYMMAREMKRSQGQYMGFDSDNKISEWIKEYCNER